MRLTNKAYDNGKYIVFLTLPLYSSLLFISSYIWDIPLLKLLMGIISLMSLVIGFILTISSNRYKRNGPKYDGQMVITQPEEGKKRFTLELNDDPEDLYKRDLVTFKIVPLEPSE